MMGQQSRTESLFYYFRLENQIPEDHLLRLIERHVDLGFVRERLKNFYSSTGRPSIDPEVLLRLLLVGYLHGITSERRLIEEVRMHLAYRCFTRLGFEQEIPDHSTLSKNRHGRFRQSGVFQEVFEEIVRRCLAVGLVEGQHLAVDGTLVAADASARGRVQCEELVDVAPLSRTVREYLGELEQQNPVAESEEPSPTGPVSTTDPDAAWAVKGGPAVLAYFDNYLIDTASRVILAVEATPARFRQEMLAARRMLQHVGKLGLRPESLGADKAYGSGEFLAWLLERNIQPHIPVIEVSRETIENVMGTLSSMIATARKWGYVAEPIKMGDLALPYRGVKPEARFFTPEQVRQIIRLAQEPFRTMFCILAMTGIRAGELLGLQVDDIDFEKRLLFIRRLVNRGHVQTVKSKASQKPLPLPGALAGILKEHLRTWRENPERWLFSNSRSRPYSADKVVMSKLWPILDALKIPHCGFHAFRHFHSTILLELGAAPQVAQAQMRHSDPRITLEVYSHVVGESQRSAVEKVAEIVAPIGPEQNGSGEWIQ